MNAWINRGLIFLAIAVAFYVGRFSASDSGSFNSNSESAGDHKKINKVPRGESDEQSKTDAISLTASRSSADTLDDLLMSLDTRKRWEALAAFGKKTASANPGKAWELLSRISGLADRQVYAESVLSEWAKTSPQAAISAAQTLAAGELKASATAAAISQWAQSSPVDAIEFAAKNLVGSNRQMAVGAAAIQWARSDAQAAANWALANQQTSSGIQAIGDIMDFWGETDPRLGAEWASKLPASPFQKQALQSVLSKWADQFPSESAEWLAKQPSLEDMKPLLAAQWAKSDPAAAAKWAYSLPESPTREIAAMEATSAWAASDPQATLEWIDKNPMGKPNSLRVQALQSWATDDPAAALAWANSQTDSSKLSEAVMNRWAEVNADGFLSWSEKLPPSGQTDTIRSIEALSLSDTKPEMAIQKAVSIGNPSLRNESMDRVLTAWKGRDLAGANKWISNNQSLLKAR